MSVQIGVLRAAFTDGGLDLEEFGDRDSCLPANVGDYLLGESGGVRNQNNTLFNAGSAGLPLPHHSDIAI